MPKHRNSNWNTVQITTKPKSVTMEQEALRILYIAENKTPLRPSPYGEDSDKYLNLTERMIKNWEGQAGLDQFHVDEWRRKKPLREIWPFIPGGSQGHQHDKETCNHNPDMKDRM